MPETQAAPPTPTVSSWPSAGLEDWRKLVERSLKGRRFDSLRAFTRDGLPIEPLYVAAGSSEPLPVAPGRWTITESVGEPDPDAANAAALAAMKGSAGGLALRFAEPGTPGSGLPPTAGAIAIALDGIDLAKVQVRIEPHAEGAMLATMLADLATARGLAPERADIRFGLDPVPMLLAGEQPRLPEPNALAAAFAALRVARFSGPFALLDGRPFYESGATEAQELAAVLAAAAWWLRALAPSAISPSEALPLLGTALAVDQDVLVSTAKLRAMRLLWGRLAEVSGAPPSALDLHAATSRRMLTRTEPHNNLLRNALAVFAAATGGADSVEVAPHTAGPGPTDANANALARNLQHLLMREAHLARVADPLAGSGALDVLSAALAERAWEEFRSIEREGGLIESLGGGPFAARIAAARKTLAEEVSGKARPIVGITAYRANPSPREYDAAGGAGPPGHLPPVRLEEFAEAAR